MLRETYVSIFNRYKSEGAILTESDAVSAIDFVHELLKAEADYIKNTESHAIRSIDEFKKAAYVVFNLSSDIDNDDFDEPQKDKEYSYQFEHNVTFDQIIDKAKKAYEKFHSENDEFTKEDAFVYVLEEWDTGYDLTKEEYAELLKQI